MKTNYFRLLSIAILTSVFFSSCENEGDASSNESLTPQTSVNSVDKNDPVVIQLINQGYKLKNIKDLNDYYLVEDDMMFSKDKSNTTAKPAQAYFNQLVNMNTVNNITVRIDSSIPTSGSDDWRSAISTALNDWNSIQGCRVNFILTTNSIVDILIGADGGILPNSTAASAFTPGSGAPGSQIAINLDARNDIPLSEAEKIHVIQHELGHTIGFRHTNGALFGDQNDPYGYNTIIYTPTGFGTSQDNNSVMNSNVPYSNGFSSYDIFAFKYLYPDTYSMSELIFSPIDGESIVSGRNGIYIYWKSSFIQEQNIKVEVFYEGVLGYSSTTPNVGGIDIPCRTGSCKVKLSSISNPSFYDEANFYFQLD